jgi:3-oxoacyl-[acyl-carrier protein] reductase
MCDVQLKNKIALVTGGSRGIGRAICMKLAQMGAEVFINFSSNEAMAQEVKNAIISLGGKAHVLGLDVADAAAVQQAIRSIVETAGGLHILVNNAGITRDTLLVRMKQEDWNRVIATNLGGVFNCTQAAISTMMKQRWGRIINIGSVVGSMGNAGQANYAAAKAGLEGFSRSVAREVASRGITVNVVAPGFIETDMTAVLAEKYKEALLSQIPVGRMGKPEDVAEAVAFLATEGAAYITGQVLHVNGGLFCG